MTNDTLFLPGLSPVERHEIHAGFDGGALSSDGGVPVLREAEPRLKFGEMIAACMGDKRDRASITHTRADMVRERMLAIACGHEDCNDMDTLRDDPVMKTALDHLPETARAPASQPTLSRLENSPSMRGLVRMGIGLIYLFCSSYKQGARPYHAGY